MFFERFLFIMAITIPFDIRDLKIDNQVGLKTIPSILGIKKSKMIAYFLLILMSAFAISNYLLGHYTSDIVYAICFIGIISSIFVRYYTRYKNYKMYKNKELNDTVPWDTFARKKYA